MAIINKKHYNLDNMYANLDNIYANLVSIPDFQGIYSYREKYFIHIEVKQLEIWNFIGRGYKKHDFS